MTGFFDFLKSAMPCNSSCIVAYPHPYPDGIKPPLIYRAFTLGSDFAFCKAWSTSQRCICGGSCSSVSACLVNSSNPKPPGRSVRFIVRFKVRIESGWCSTFPSSTREAINALSKKREKMAKRILETRVTAMRLRISLKNDFIQTLTKPLFSRFVEEKLCLPLKRAQVSS